MVILTSYVNVYQRANRTIIMLPSGNQTWLGGKSTTNGGFIGKITDRPPFSAMSDCRRVYYHILKAMIYEAKQLLNY